MPEHLSLRREPEGGVLLRTHDERNYPLKIGWGLLLGFASLGLVFAFLLTDTLLGPSLALGISAAVVTVIYCVVLFRLKPLFLLLAFLFVLGQVGSILSGVLIEAGAYISEEGRFGFPDGATLRLNLYFLVFLVAALLFFEVIRRSGLLRSGHGRVHTPTGLRIVVYVLAAAFLAYAFLGLAINGSPLVEHHDRFSYWRTNRLPVLQVANNQLSTFVFLMSLLMSTRKRRMDRLYAVAFVILTIVYFVLVGQKFTAFVNVGYSFLLPIFGHALRSEAVGHPS